MPMPPAVARPQTPDPPPSNHLPDPSATAHSDSGAPAVVGLVGDRPIEPIISDYATADSAAAPAAEQIRRPVVPRRAASTGVPGVAAVQSAAVQSAAVQSTVQRSMGAATTPAATWLPGVLPVSRSSPGVDRPASPALPVQVAAPIAAETIPPGLTTQLVVQRADDAGEHAATTSPTTATSPAGETPPAPSAGPTSPTEVDTLVRRLYDPIVRRLKAELQLDRERAGHSLDLRH